MLVGKVGLAMLSLVLGANGSRLRDSFSLLSVNYRPSPDELRESYARADSQRQSAATKAFKLRVVPHWYDEDRHFWYRNDLQNGTREFIDVETTRGHRSFAFDHVRLAAGLSKAASSAYTAWKLPFDAIEFSPDLKSISFNVEPMRWKCDLSTYECAQVGPATAAPVTSGVVDFQEPDELSPYAEDPRYITASDAQRRRGQNRDLSSPDGKWTYAITDGNLHISAKDAGKAVSTKMGVSGDSYVAARWSPDSKVLVGIRMIPGDRKDVYLIESSPSSGGRAKLRTRVYDLPGDKLDTFDLVLIDPAKGSETPVRMDAVDTGDQPEIRWKSDPRYFTYEKTDRGHGRFRIVEVDAQTGETRNLVDHIAKTFIDITSDYTYYCTATDEIIWRSEKDGYGHLYLVDGKKGVIENAITKGDWVVRGVDQVDEKARQVWFHASGKNRGQDPYLIQYYRVNFDGTGLTALTEANGNHTILNSPTGKFLIDTYSRVDLEPTFELRRRSDGRLISRFDKAEISLLKASGWNYPEVFVSKARDGVTDIWGVVFRPSTFDPNKRYPIIENIYAGPQDSFVPKSFSASNRMQSLAELGFVVIQVDGMGTRNRSKAFHDVCWKNLADAGFPDRILWMKALAAKYPTIDLSRVGIYGTSAGGQNSTGAMLFHPEFYKVAVSCAGCHDNRMDKVWWNEQWMGYPVGPHYAEQSNITNAAKLKGKLLLMVGELDTNVPPESTLRLVDALIKANKDFQFLMLPGFDHTDGGPYGERKRRDFFVHNLLGVEPPDHNAN
jgi:dipeptidyl aminopeptidase/acylaminoacyl peptidase